MIVKVFCPDTKKEVSYEVGKINTKHLMKLLSSSEKIGGKLVQAGNMFQLDKNNITGAMMTLISGDLISFIFQEGISIVADIIGKPIDYVERLDPADTMELITGIVTETDFEKLGSAIKKLINAGVIKIPKK